MTIGAMLMPQPMVLTTKGPEGNCSGFMRALNAHSHRHTRESGYLIPSPVRGRGLEPAPLQNGGEGVSLSKTERLPTSQKH